jgi:hypothetical protein
MPSATRPTARHGPGARGGGRKRADSGGLRRRPGSLIEGGPFRRSNDVPETGPASSRLRHHSRRWASTPTDVANSRADGPLRLHDFKTRRASCSRQRRRGAGALVLVLPRELVQSLGMIRGSFPRCAHARDPSARGGRPDGHLCNALTVTRGGGTFVEDVARLAKRSTS